MDQLPPPVPGPLPPPVAPTSPPRRGLPAAAIVAVALAVPLLGLLAWLLLRGDGDGDDAVNADPTVASTAVPTTTATAAATTTAPTTGTGARPDGRAVSVYDLEPGMCFDPDLERDTQDVAPTVWVFECAEPHRAEVVTVFDSALGDGDYRQAELEQEAEETCAADVGAADLDDQPDDLQSYYLYPSPDTWADGDREIVCLALSEEGLDGSVLD